MPSPYRRRLFDLISFRIKTEKPEAFTQNKCTQFLWKKKTRTSNIVYSIYFRLYVHWLWLVLLLVRWRDSKLIKIRIFLCHAQVEEGEEKNFYFVTIINSSPGLLPLCFIRFSFFTSTFLAAELLVVSRVSSLPMRLLSIAIEHKT